MTGTDPVLRSSRLTASPKPRNHTRLASPCCRWGSTRRSVKHARTISAVLASAPAATAFLVLDLQWHLLLLVETAQSDCSEVIGVLTFLRCPALAAPTLTRKGSGTRGHRQLPYRLPRAWLLLPSRRTASKLRLSLLVDIRKSHSQSGRKG